MSDKKSKLDLKRPRSGIFINEKPRPENRDIPYETYNPRQLQEKLEKEGRKKYTLVSEGEQLYFPWKKDDMGDSKMLQENALRQDCIDFKPVIFPIPDDLDKTFRAGVVFGNNVLFPRDEAPGPQRPTELASLYVAYVESFAKNPDYWTAESVDTILERGSALQLKSITTNYENPSEDFAILPELTEQKSTVAMKLHLTGALTDEPNILKALSLFFDKYHAGVVCSTNLYFLIWKRCANSFYIFDPNGRNGLGQRDFQGGKASLIAIETVEHIVHLILNHSDVSSTADFNLYEIQLVDFGKLSKPLRIDDVKPAKKLYSVVNRYYAVIPAISGLPFAIVSEKGPQDNPSMMASYLAVIYSQIDPPRLWTMTLVNDLIKFGRKYHSDYVSDNRLGALNIADLPEVLLFGNYRVLVEKKAFFRSGHVVDCWSHRVSQLTQALNHFFSEYNTGLLQVDNSTVGLWRANQILMVFDPFKREPSGLANPSAKGGAGCVQMHVNVDSLCRILCKNSKIIKSEGNFFLHGICVKAVGTFSINRAREDAAGFGILQIKYPFDCCGALIDPEQELDCKKNELEMDLTNCTILQCLSALSISPCQRTCSERDFILKQKKIALQSKLGKAASIQSLPEEYHIPEYENVDVIDSIVAEFVCDLMTTIQKRTEKTQKVSIEASKILLKSDMGHLEDLKLCLKRGEDYDNICVAFETKPPGVTVMTLEEELALDSNFRPLLDGSWGIFGVQLIDIADESFVGILSIIAAAAISSKYNVSTWSSDVIEYAHQTSKALQQRFWSYNHTLDLIFRKQIPKLKLGFDIYALNVVCTKTVLLDKLKDSIEQSLVMVTKLFLLSKSLSCLIMRRYNFIYMFMGCSCDVFGFKSKSAGPMCLLRFVELNALVQRIESACDRCGNFVIVPLEVKDVTVGPSQKFRQFRPSQEDLVYNREVLEKQRQTQRYTDKMRFIQDEIRKESERVEQFKKEAGKNGPKTLSRKVESSASSETTSSQLMEREYEELDEETEGVELRNALQKSLKNLGEQEKMGKIGYALRDKDCLFKIQGTTFLDNRRDASVDQIKTCFFASAVGLLHAILRPLNHWDARRIDKVIYVAKNIAKTTSNMNTANERIIKNIDVDEFIFNVKVQVFTPLGTFGGNIAYKLMKTIQTQRYFLIQISNTTFGVYHDKYFHLFDPYGSMDRTSDDVQPAESPDSIPKRAEENTASWVLFGELDAMLDYIGRRAVSSEWKTEFKLHIVNIMSYKQAPKRLQLLNLLTDEIGSDREKTGTGLCAHPEQIEWLDIYPNLVSWSRLNRHNAVQRVRGSTFTRDRNFDVEIPDKLYSLWGSIHPESAVFGEYRGKQHLAIGVVACCVASVYELKEWNSQILDSIVINGNKYFKDSVIKENDIEYEFSLEHLNTSFQMAHLQFTVTLGSRTCGYLYSTRRKELGLWNSLTHFFLNHPFGIIQCMKRSVAIGKTDSGFFMFDCQSHGLPLFHTGQGAAYLLRAVHLQTLLYCIIMTFNIPYFNAMFYIHKVEIVSGVLNATKAEAEEQIEEEDA